MASDTTPVEAVEAIRETLSSTSTVGTVLRFRDEAKRLATAATSSPASIPVGRVADTLAVAFETHAMGSSGAESLFGVDKALAAAYHACLETIELASTAPEPVDAACSAWRTVLGSLPADVAPGVRYHALAAASGLGGPPLHSMVAEKISAGNAPAATAGQAHNRYRAEIAAHLARTMPANGEVVATLRDVDTGDDPMVVYWQTVATVHVQERPTGGVFREESIVSRLDTIFDGTMTLSGLGSRLQFGRAVGALPPEARALAVGEAMQASADRISTGDTTTRRIGIHALWALLTDSGRDPLRAPAQLARATKHASLFGFGTETPRAVGTGIGQALASIHPPRRRQIAAAVLELFDPESDRYLLHPPSTDRMNASWTASPRDLYRFLQAIGTTVGDDATRRVLAPAIEWGFEHPRHSPRTAAVEAAVVLRESSSTGSSVAEALEAVLGDALRDGTQPLRETVVTALIERHADGDVPVWSRDHLLRVLNAPDPEHQLEGAQVLADIADDLPAAVRQRLVECITAAHDSGRNPEQLLPAVERCCRALQGRELEEIASVAHDALDQSPPPLVAVEAISALATNDRWTPSTATVERLVELAVNCDTTPLRVSAAGALEAFGPQLGQEAREHMRTELRMLIFGVPEPVRRAGAGLAGRLVDALSAEFVRGCLNHHDGAVTDAFVTAVGERSGATTDSVPQPEPTGIEYLLRSALETDHSTAYAVVIGTRSLGQLTAEDRASYVAFLTDALTDGQNHVGRAALVEHALAIVREHHPALDESWPPTLKGLAEAVVVRFQGALRSDNWTTSQSAVRALFEDALPVLGFADEEIRESLAMAAESHVKARKAMYKHFPTLYDELSDERRQDWMPFLVDLPVDTERTPHALIRCLPELAAKSSVNDAVLRTLLAQVAAEVNPETWPDSRETPGTHLVEHLYALLERRPRVYESFPVLRRHVLATADTTGAEYVSALLEFDTLAVERGN